MRKTIFSLIALLVITAIGFSCSDDKNEIYGDNDITEGIWITDSRYVITGITELDEKHINSNLKVDGDSLRIEQTFNKTAKTSRLVAFSKKTGAEIRNSNYSYEIVGDSIFLNNPITTKMIMKGSFKATKRKLELRYHVTKRELIPIMQELYVDNNILSGYPDDLKGTFILISSR